jgi:hypothetical protein
VIDVDRPAPQGTRMFLRTTEGLGDARASGPAEPLSSLPQTDVNPAQVDAIARVPAGY